MGGVTIPIRRLPIIPLCVLLAVSCCPAQTGSPWRTWNAADGFDESYTGGVALMPNGNVLVQHGEVARMNVLDGYLSPQYPDPKTEGKLTSAPDGTLWMWTGNRLMRLLDSHWSSYSVEVRSPAADRGKLVVAPLDRTRPCSCYPIRYWNSTLEACIPAGYWRRSRLALSNGFPAFAHRAREVFMSADGVGPAGSRAPPEASGIGIDCRTHRLPMWVSRSLSTGPARAFC